jgi:hypothetical protein
MCVCYLDRGGTFVQFAFPMFFCGKILQIAKFALFLLQRNAYQIIICRASKNCNRKKYVESWYTD